MPSEKRQRQDEGRLLRLEAERQAQTKARRNTTTRNLVGAVVLVAVVGLAWALISGGGGDDTSATDETTSSSTPGVEVPLPKAGATLTGATPCPAADGSAKRTTTFAKAPPTCIDGSKTYTAVVKTSEGDITIALDSKAAPIAVNNFVVLSRYHFYDGVAFHRIIPGFMDQTGDATGPRPGMGDAGYEIPDELPTGDNPYPTGSVAMGNSGAPDSGGSQFFITVEGGGERLGPSYTRFGSVAAGQDVVDAINQYGIEEADGAPTKLVTITSVTITES